MIWYIQAELHLFTIIITELTFLRKHRGSTFWLGSKGGKGSFWGQKCILGVFSFWGVVAYFYFTALRASPHPQHFTQSQQTCSAFLLFTFLWKAKQTAASPSLTFQRDCAENKHHLMFSGEPICGRFFPHSWEQIMSGLVFNLDLFHTLKVLGLLAEWI